MAIKFAKSAIIVAAICLLLQKPIQAVETRSLDESPDLSEVSGLSEAPLDQRTIAADSDDAVLDNTNLDDDAATSEEEGTDGQDRPVRSWDSSSVPARLGSLDTGYGYGVGRVGGLSLGSSRVAVAPVRVAPVRRVGLGRVRVPAHGGSVGKSTLLQSQRSRTDQITGSRVAYVPRRVTIHGQKTVTVPYYRRVTTTVRNLGPGNARVRKVLTGESHAPVPGAVRSYYRPVASGIVPTVAVKGLGGFSPLAGFTRVGDSGLGLGAARVGGLGYGYGYAPVANLGFNRVALNNVW